MEENSNPTPPPAPVPPPRPVAPPPRPAAPPPPSAAMPRPTPKTAAVPLKKETVRVTLRPDAPAGNVPPATVPLAPPPRPGMGAPPPPAGGPPRPAPPPAPAGSKTIPLGQTPPRPATPVTRPVTPGAPASPGAAQPLPQATVKLAPSAAPAASVSSAPVRAAQFDEEEETDEGTLNILGWVSLAASIAVALLTVASWDGGPLSEGKAVTQAQRDAWASDNIPESFKLPLDYSPFDTKTDDGRVISKFEDEQPVIPPRPVAE